MGTYESRALRGQGAVADGHERTQNWQGSSVFTQVAVLTRRAILSYLSDPRAVVLGLLPPIIILFLMGSAFSKLTSHTPGIPPGVSYFQFVLPAVLVNCAINAAVQTGASLVDELKNGVAARLRSLPILPSSILIARSFSGLIRTAVQVLVLLVLAQLTYRNVSLGGFTGMVAAVGLTLLMGWFLGWVFLMAGIWVRRTDAMLSLAFLASLPLMFVSSAYIPADDLPTVLAAIARVNPVTYAINAERAIFLKTAGSTISAGVILPPILISVVLGVASAYGAVRLFRRPLQANRQ
jgi:ABC-2 type transport system permease protein